MKKTRIFAMVLALLLTAAFCGCGSTGATSDGSTASNDTASTVSDEADVSTDKVSTAESTESKTVSSGVSSVANTSSKETVIEEKLPTVDGNSDWRSHVGDYKLMAFTFDDAPNSATVNDSDTFTQIIRSLYYYHGAGTAFVIGSYLNKNGPTLLNYALKYGFELGNHTYTHGDMANAELAANYNTDKYLNDQILKNNKLIEEKCGVTPKFLRASGLHTTEFVIEAAAAANMPLICGNKPNAAATATTTQSATSDWSGSVTTEHIYDAIVNYAYDGKIICLHSTSSKTAEILPEALKTLYNNGYRFVTLSELFEYKLGVTDISKVDVAKSATVGTKGSLGVYGTEDVKLKK